MKRIFIVFPFLCVLWNISAQNLPKRGGRLEHVIDVVSYSDWGKGFLTITDAHIVESDNILYGLTFEPIANNSAIYIPEVADIILEVNGISTKDMKPEKFYAITDTATFFTLKFTYSRWKRI